MGRSSCGGAVHPWGGVGIARASACRAMEGHWEVLRVGTVAVGRGKNATPHRCLVVMVVVLAIGVVRHRSWGHCAVTIIVGKWGRGARGLHGIRLPHGHLWGIVNALTGEASVMSMRGFAGVSIPLGDVLKVS